jgi:hypothetical protein
MTAPAYEGAQRLAGNAEFDFPQFPLSAEAFAFLAKLALS